MLDVVHRTVIVPETPDDLGIIVSTLTDGNMYETMVLGGEFDAVDHRCDNHKEALDTHEFWVKYLREKYGF
jgi:hypothetical protein